MALIHKGITVKKASFVGFGKSNRALFSYLYERYPDIEFLVRIPKSEGTLPRGVRAFIGDDMYKQVDEDVLFLSPSVKRNLPVFSERLTSSDAEFFFEKNENDVFGITGSDGKSTTTTLTARLLESSYARAYAIGNIGEPFTPHLSDMGGTAYAAELSSFQLTGFAPPLKRALITNITPNHLDWHSSFEEYAGAKENVLKRAHYLALGADSDIMQELIRKYKPDAVFSYTLSESEIKAFKVQTYVYIKNGALFVNGKKEIELRDISRREAYNVKNLMAAMALTHGFYTHEELASLAKNFSGLEHRFELVCECFGVKFYNSSIDSSPMRTLNTLSELSYRYVLILGGRTKMKNYEILRDILRKNAHALVLTGENREEIREKLSELSSFIYTEEDFNSAVLLAYSLAMGKYPVILSPASTSFDSFRSFEERGAAFKDAVFKIKKKEIQIER